jgi:hypothetical protein
MCKGDAMKATLFGVPNRRAAAVVGAWDPLMLPQQEMFENLARYASRVSLLSAAVLLEPNPASLVPDSPSEWPPFDDPLTRVEMIQALGIDAVLVIHFKRSDLDAPLVEFFATIAAHIELDELFVGDGQTLGRGPESSNEMLNRIAAQRNFQVTRMPPMRFRTRPSSIRKMLQAGQLKKAIEIVGHAPVWHRRSGEHLNLPWPAGRYALRLMREMTGDAEGVACVANLQEGAGGLSAMRWPDTSFDWAAFVAGPGDLTQDTTTPESGGAAFAGGELGPSGSADSDRDSL